MNRSYVDSNRRKQTREMMDGGEYITQGEAAEILNMTATSVSKCMRDLGYNPESGILDKVAFNLWRVIDVEAVAAYRQRVRSRREEYTKAREKASKERKERLAARVPKPKRKISQEMESAIEIGVLAARRNLRSKGVTDAIIDYLFEQSDLRKIQGGDDM